MAKSKRSKVKMVYRTMRRAALQERLDKQQRALAEKVYNAIGMPLPEDGASKGEDITRSHNGSDIVSTFTPTPKGPKLNVVHGPLANKSATSVEAPVVGFPVAGAGQRARRASGQPMDMDKSSDGKTKIDVARVEKRPVFYHRKDYKDSAIRKQKRQRQNQGKLDKKLSSLRMEVEQN